MPEASKTSYDIINLRCGDPLCEDKAEAYRMVGGCYNCGTKPLIGLFTAGHEHGTRGTCPACGCNRLYWNRLARPDEVGIPGTAENPECAEYRRADCEVDEDG